jgi:hypothetical protein
MLLACLPSFNCNPCHSSLKNFASGHCLFNGRHLRRRTEVNKNFSRGKKLRHVPFFLQSQRNEGVGWTNCTSNPLFFSQLRRSCHHLTRWPPGPLGPFFKPSRLEKAHSAPPNPTPPPPPTPRGAHFEDGRKGTLKEGRNEGKKEGRKLRGMKERK